MVSFRPRKFSHFRGLIFDQVVTFEACSGTGMLLLIRTFYVAQLPKKTILRRPAVALTTVAIIRGTTPNSTPNDPLMNLALYR